MNNFISTFDELSKLYEEVNLDEEAKEETVEETVEESCTNEELTESAEDEEIEIIDDEVPAEEVPAEEPVEEEEPKQVVLECSKCGALVIKDEADVVVDEESGLANTEDKCAFCEESEGFKTVGTFLPYESEENIDDAESSEESEIEDTAEEISVDDAVVDEI